jgi:hypothetical protein
MRITRTGEIGFDHPDSVISPSRQGTTALCAFLPLHRDIAEGPESVAFACWGLSLSSP